jgi:tetratricopeptide (TPR) repeat protein
MSDKSVTNAIQAAGEPRQGCLNRWKCAIARGNTEFGLRYFGNAILMYQQALDIARFDFPDTARRSIDEAIAKVVITHFNLADCYIALEEIERAADLYLDAQNFLLNLQAPTYLSQDEFRQALMHAASHGNFLWMEFVKKYRGQLDQDQLLRYHRGCGRLTNREVCMEVVH